MNLVQRQALQQRLSRLEKRLKVPKKDRHECAGKLKKADEELVLGIRVRKRADSVAIDKTSKVVNGAQVVQCHVPISVQLQGKHAVQAHEEALKVIVLCLYVELLVSYTVSVLLFLLEKVAGSTQG